MLFLGREHRLPAPEQGDHDRPDGFRLDTGRQSHPADPEADANERILAAAESCPVEAIVITLLGSGEPVFPPEE